MNLEVSGDGMSAHGKVGMTKYQTSRENGDWLNVVAEVASAYASKESSTVAQILDLVDGLLTAAHPLRLSHSENGEPKFRLDSVASNPTPAVPLDAAVQKDKIVCLCCGKSFTMLKRHLKAEHGLTEAEYRSQFGLPDDMPLVAPSYSAKKAEYARSTGLGKHSRETDPKTRT